MKQWWAKYKQRLAERQKVAAANMERLAADVEQMRLEQWKRRQAKKDLRLARRLLEATEATPPRFAIYLGLLFLPKRYREIILGDIVEQYPTLRIRLGRFRAWVRVYKQVFFSIWPLVKDPLGRLGAVILYRWEYIIFALIIILTVLGLILIPLFIFVSVVIENL